MTEIAYFSREAEKFFKYLQIERMDIYCGVWKYPELNFPFFE